jgi:hypothetical protein
LSREKISKKGQKSTKKLFGFGNYLMECEAMKQHVSKPLMSRLHKVKEDRNQFAHGSGLLCKASRGLGYCVLGFELLEEVGPKSSMQASQLAQAGRPATKGSVFVSWRMSECKAEVKVLRTALEAKGVKVIVIGELPGGDLLQAVTQGMEAADLFIVMGTETYGRQTSGIIDTYKEMQYIISSKKPFFLVNMNPEPSLMRFQEGAANLVFNLNTVSWKRWAVGAPMSPKVVEEILQKLLEGSAAASVLRTVDRKFIDNII